MWKKASKRLLLIGDGWALSVLFWFKTGSMFKYHDSMLHSDNNVYPKCPITKKGIMHMIAGIEL